MYNYVDIIHDYIHNVICTYIHMYIIYIIYYVDYVDIYITGLHIEVALVMCPST